MIINRKDPPSQIATNIEITFDLRIHGCCIFITWPGTERHGTLRARFSPPCPSSLRWRVRVQRCARWCGSARGRGSPHVQDSEREPLQGAAWALPPCRPRVDGTRRCARGLRYVQMWRSPHAIGTDVLYYGPKNKSTGKSVDESSDALLPGAGHPRAEGVVTALEAGEGILLRTVFWVLRILFFR